MRYGQNFTDKGGGVIAVTIMGTVIMVLGIIMLLSGIILTVVLKKRSK